MPDDIALCFGIFFLLSPFPFVTNVVVLTVTVWLSGVFTCTFACGILPHLQAIQPGMGNLSCGWLPQEQMFLMPLVGGKKIFESDSIKEMPAVQQTRTA